MTQPTAGDDQALLSLQCATLREVASGLPLRDIADALCRRVEAIVPKVVCTVLLLDKQNRLRPLAGPSLPPAYNAAVDGIAIEPMVGCCGSAAYLGVAVETIDIANDPRWTSYRHMPLLAGFRGCWSTPIMNKSGKVVATFTFYFREPRPLSSTERRIVNVCVDVCALAIEREDVQADLVAAHRNLNVALNSMTQGLCLYDGSDRLLLTNPRFREIYGQAAGSLTPGMHLREVLADSIRVGNYPGRTVDDVWIARKVFIDKRETGVFLQEMGDGRLIAISHQPLDDGGWVATYEDVTERERHRARISHLAQHDVLTGLPNRALLQERLALALEQDGEVSGCAVLFLDLDRFKAVNDTFGHHAGDRLLLEASARLRANVRDTDVVARLGGDEFSILLSAVEGSERAEELATRLIKVLSSPYLIDGQTVYTSASIGIARSPLDGSTGAELLRNADVALYQAKAEGRATFRCFSQVPKQQTVASAAPAGRPNSDASVLHS